MKKVLNILSTLFIMITLILIALYKCYHMDFLLTLAISFGTTAYHFVMRLLIGYIVDYFMHNQANYHKKWYQSLPFEMKVYEILKVKDWKDKMPTYNPETFSLESHSFEQIVSAMCQAEIVHEFIVIFSFLPIAVIPFFGAAPVFIITSILAACVDLMFVMIQRYNRPRIIKIIERRNSR